MEYHIAMSQMEEHIANQEQKILNEIDRKELVEDCDPLRTIEEGKDMDIRGFLVEALEKKDEIMRRKCQAIDLLNRGNEKRIKKEMEILSNAFV